MIIFHNVRFCRRHAAGKLLVMNKLQAQFYNYIFQKLELTADGDNVHPGELSKTTFEVCDMLFAPNVSPLLSGYLHIILLVQGEGQIYLCTFGRKEKQNCFYLAGNV